MINELEESRTKETGTPAGYVIVRKWAEEVANGTEIDEQRWNIRGFVRGEEAKDGVAVPGLGI